MFVLDAKSTILLKFITWQSKGEYLNYWGVHPVAHVSSNVNNITCLLTLLKESMFELDHKQCKF
jgi:hypothetical protein